MCDVTGDGWGIAGMADRRLLADVMACLGIAWENVKEMIDAIFIDSHFAIAYVATNGRGCIGLVDRSDVQ